MRKYKTGKLGHSVLADLLNRSRTPDGRVKIRPGTGEDVCAIRMGDNYLVATGDPVTLATERTGWYVVHINANDLATAGATPAWFFVTVLLPENKTDKTMVQKIWDDMEMALFETDCFLCGGHTEVTAGVDRPILAGYMLGEVPAAGLIDKKSVRPGDRILLTKSVPVEGTAIIAHEKGEILSEFFSGDELESAGKFLDSPGISVLAEARAACRTGGVKAMHDPTEGGIATGLWELAVACGLGMKVRESDIPIIEPGGRFCEVMGIDPLGTIASGSLLICADPSLAGEITREIEREGVACMDIGEMLPSDSGIKLVCKDSSERDMPVFEQDEITKIF